ncbi:bacteriophage p2 gpl capsid protein [Alcanivorax sp. S71-1-4]|uniref:head completion/stabilization protein n=1 Tax=Alcanivorax sp. S71-1-4 TaxID=1177159 RepID=UPI00135AD3D1|nr:head completion/stabilization protein [Alcanivorax sp. S71-1-4]KAF0810444.1 bacteriophage p2 gpl capsid protein [Alcanivorax sp. S71-1-4]
MSFVVTGNGSEPAQAIENDGFFPAIEPEDFRAAMREDKTVPNERLAAVLIEAMISVNRELAPLRTRHPGAQTLADIDAPHINGESVMLHRYRRAVYAHAKAELLERYVDYDSTNSAQGRGEQKQDTADDQRRNLRWAISDLLGTPRIKVELI